MGSDKAPKLGYVVQSRVRVLRGYILTVGPTQILEKCKSQIPNSFYPNLIYSVYNRQRMRYGYVSRRSISGIDMHLRYGSAPQVWACILGMGVHRMYPMCHGDAPIFTAAAAADRDL